MQLHKSKASYEMFALVLHIFKALIGDSLVCKSHYILYNHRGTIDLTCAQTSRRKITIGYPEQYESTAVSSNLSQVELYTHVHLRRQSGTNVFAHICKTKKKKIHKT